MMRSAFCGGGGGPVEQETSISTDKNPIKALGKSNLEFIGMPRAFVAILLTVKQFRHSLTSITLILRSKFSQKSPIR
jgi:hypothetical protein